MSPLSQGEPGAGMQRFPCVAFSNNDCDGVKDGWIQHSSEDELMLLPFPIIYLVVREFNYNGVTSQLSYRPHGAREM